MSSCSDARDTKSPAISGVLRRGRSGRLPERPVLGTYAWRNGRIISLGHCCSGVANKNAAAQSETASFFVAGSGEAERLSLVGPRERQGGVRDELLCGEAAGLPALQDGAGDIGGEKGQAQ